MLTVLLLSSAAYGQGSPDTTQSSKVLRLGLVDNLFAGVNQTDAEAALQVWVSSLAKTMTRGYTTERMIFLDRSSMMRAVRDGQVHLVAMTSLDYIEVRDDISIEPSLVGIQMGGQVLLQYTLLVQRDANIRSLEQLKHRKIVVGTQDEGRLAQMWLDVLLLRKGLPESRDYVSIAKVDKALKALLQVFFGHADACIVTDGARKTMAELNPQIIEHLEVLNRSSKLLPSITCFCSDSDVNIQRILLDSALKLHQETEGQQVLTLFHVERCDLFRPSYLENTEALVEEYLDLRNP